MFLYSVVSSTALQQIPSDYLWFLKAKATDIFIHCTASFAARLAAAVKTFSFFKLIFLPRPV
jgi:hypothetical protein